MPTTTAKTTRLDVPCLGFATGFGAIGATGFTAAGAGALITVRTEVAGTGGTENLVVEDLTALFFTARLAGAFLATFFAVLFFTARLAGAFLATFFAALFFTARLAGAFLATFFAVLFFTARLAGAFLATFFAALFFFTAT